MTAIKNSFNRIKRSSDKSKTAPFGNFSIRKQTLTLLFMCAPTFALAAGDDNRLSTLLNGLIALLTSDVARLIFIVAIIGIGYGWLYLGQIPKGRAIGAIVGIGIVYSAGWIAQQLGVGT